MKFHTHHNNNNKAGGIDHRQIDCGQISFLEKVRGKNGFMNKCNQGNSGGKEKTRGANIKRSKKKRKKKEKGENISKKSIL